jgi:MFS family permease
MHNSYASKLVGTASGLLIVLVTGSIFFGWGSISAIMLSEGTYEEECSKEGLPSPCTRQEERIHLIYAVGTVSYAVVSLPVGIFLDKFGRAITLLCGLLIVSLGSFLFSQNMAFGAHCILLGVFLTLQDRDSRVPCR